MKVLLCGELSLGNLREGPSWVNQLTEYFMRRADVLLYHATDPEIGLRTMISCVPPGKKVNDVLLAILCFKCSVQNQFLLELIQFFHAQVTSRILCFYPHDNKFPAPPTISGCVFSSSAPSVNFVDSIWPEIQVCPDPITRSYSNSASTSNLIPVLPFWDQLALFPQPKANQTIAHNQWKLGKPTMILLGDSITQQSQGNPAWCLKNSGSGPGWGDMLQAQFSATHHIVNRGLSGYNSKWVLERFEELDLVPGGGAAECDVLVVFLGANDATVSLPQHVSLQDFEANVNQLIDRCVDVTQAKRVILVGAPPVGHDKYVEFRRNRSAENTLKSKEELLDRTYLLARQYNLAMRRIAEEKHLEFVDLFSLFGTRFTDCFYDGLHFNALGNELLGLEMISRLTQQNLPSTTSKRVKL